MFEINSKIIDKNKGNTLIKKTISLENNLDCFIHIESKSKNFADGLLNSIVENIIDKISISNTYGDFSIALENINSFIKTWNTDKIAPETSNVIISLLNENSFIFSNIWKASAYLINKNEELINLTDTKENKNDFSYISNGELRNNEVIILSTQNILVYLSPSDILDGLDNQKNLSHFTDNISSILDAEILWENVLYSSFKYKNWEFEDHLDENQYITYIQDKYYLLLDTVFIKKILTLLLKIKDSIISQSKIVKNILFIIWISVCVLFLYSTLSNVVSIVTNDKKKVQTINDLEQANTFIRQASRNVANIDAFEENITAAESIITKVKEQKIYLWDLEKMQKDIHILKKQFNKIETFETNSENEIYAGNFDNFVKIVKNKLKPYIIEKNSITWPINTWKKAKKYTNTQLDADEFFIDATMIWDDIYLNTNKSKIVRFAKTWHFSFMDVSWQEKWESNKAISSYANNIYLLDDKKAQIYKHSLSGNKFSKAKEYLNADDVKAIWEILSIAIDWWFFILKKDLSMQKFFASPKYEMTWITLNKLPSNYKLESPNSKVEIKTRSELNYVYMLLNNKIFVFQSNTRNYKDTKSLTYIWQIEGNWEKIKDFYVNHDGKLWVINSKGIYDLSFEISDDKLIIR